MINTTGATPVALVNSVDYNDYGESVRPSQIQLVFVDFLVPGWKDKNSPVNTGDV